ncbi:DUF3253 domain-containing protein [Phenylobacterium sp.]|uniref:DUF3253 domain-containing protein n=1 Tax=Phenylobacterium sp. TaxID=1871053 RepID=UPI002735B4E5|nr:DUF3253 domain-containing protein [Phenylobacterium sp.]MDP3659537.1 DUF3253 domain-containing protein [Phenylobacterium sp.]
MSEAIETAMLELIGKLAPGKSVSPEEVARAADPENWRRRLGHVRAVARGLARQGRIEITRHGKTADPEQFKGVYRLRAPQPVDAAQAQGDGS